MSDRSEFRMLSNRKKAQENQLIRSYKRGISTILNKTATDVNIPSVEFMTKTLLRSITTPTLSVYRLGKLNALQDVERLSGRDLPKEVYQSVGVQKAFSKTELLNLGTGNDLIAINKLGFLKLKTMSQSLNAVLKKEFVASVAAGESQAKLIARIGTVKAQAGWRSKRIAQTEMTKVYNAGTLKGYAASTVVSQKRWLTNVMGNPRPAHLAANRQQRQVGTPFDVGGEKLMMPGAPNGRADNVINCHCGMMPIVGKHSPFGVPFIPKVPKKPVTPQLPPAYGAPKPKPVAAKPIVLPRTPLSSERQAMMLQDKKIAGAYYADIGSELGISKASHKNIQQASTNLQTKKGLTVGVDDTKDIFLIKESIRNFTGGASVYMREKEYNYYKMKKKGLPYKVLEPEKDIIRKTVALHEMIETAVYTESTPLYRGISLKVNESLKFKEIVKKLEADKVVIMDSMTSFSTKAGTGEIFGQITSLGRNSIIFTIENPKGIKALDVASVSLHPNEAEVIVGQGSHFRVSKITKAKKLVGNGSDVRVSLERIDIAKSVALPFDEAAQDLIHDIFNRDEKNRG